GRMSEIFALLGPNGAGKTTTIRILLDKLRPDAGTARVLGGPPGAARDRIGYLPQERGLYPDWRVERCLTYLGELKGMAGVGARKSAQELLARVELYFLTAGEANAPLARLLSVVPPASPGIMLFRLASGPVPAADVFASLAVLLVSIPLLFYLVLKLFRT